MVIEVEEVQMISVPHVHLQSCLMIFKIVKNCVFQEEGTDGILVCSYQLKNRCSGAKLM